MKQTDLAKNMSVTPQWWCAVVNGRADAGKKLAAKMSAMVGGAIDIWMLERHRATRKGIVESYISAVNNAHQG